MGGKSTGLLHYRGDHGLARNASKTLYTALVSIKTFIKWAVHRELLGRNPLAVCKVSTPYVPPKTSATLEEVNRILQAASGAGRAQYAMLAFSGIRAGELQHLRPRDVDLEGGWIHVRARKVPIHPRLVEILKSLPKAAGPYFFCAAASPRYPRGDPLPTSST